ncbi:MAG: ribosome maturation factor RimM [Pseudomonadales bacterium]|nr:ribosome maturation factor RimM [Pseudomonadales bacterium]MBO6596327.1 ribosome maturation factor RimM [Pseudomonadales bacterium]MBO6822807.1 ribosome maturation factor RimM [Pseudomonadales bacterium]
MTLRGRALVKELRLGSINGSHGIKGWVKVFSYTDPMEAILDYSPWILKKGREEKEVKVRKGQVSGKRLIALLEDVDSRNAADALIGYEVHVAQDALPELEPGEYYWYQLEGLTVRDRDGAVFGLIDHMLETGANDVMVVKPTDESIDDQERLIPFVDNEIVIKVDQVAGEVVVDWQIDY